MKKRSAFPRDILENSRTATTMPERTQAEKKIILQTRGQELARPPAKEETNREQMEVLEFLLAHETYAVASTDVREVYPLTDLTPLPCTPAFVYGLINIRGQILTVIDIKKFFDLPEKGITNLNNVIVIRDDAKELGILADEIRGIRNVPKDDIQPPLPTLTGIQAEYLKGITGERLIVLDMERFLSDERLIVNQDVER